MQVATMPRHHSMSSVIMHAHNTPQFFVAKLKQDSTILMRYHTMLSNELLAWQDNTTQAVTTLHNHPALMYR